MDKVLLMVGLGVSALQDLRWKKVWLPLLWGITTILLLKNFLVSNKGFSWFLCAIFFLAFFLAMHRISGGQIGVGDAFLFGMTGAGLGWKGNCILVYVTFFLTFVVALPLVVLKKRGRKYEMPLSPFVLAAYLFVAFG
jgi:Type IV leader peptidase family.